MHAVRCAVGTIVLAVIMLFVACAAIQELLEPRKKPSQVESSW